MTPEKTPEQLMKDFRLGKPMYIDNTPKPLDYHTMALLAAQTIPNQTVGELLASADKIEAWLIKPEMDRISREEKFTKMNIREWELLMQGDWKQKSPEKINPEASDGVRGD